MSGIHLTVRTTVLYNSVIFFTAYVMIIFYDNIHLFLQNVNYQRGK